MFIVLGAATFVIAVSYTAALSRFRRKDLYVGSLGIFALVILFEWVAIHLEVPLLYPVLWISINVISAVLALQVWHVAGEVTDTAPGKALEFDLYQRGDCRESNWEHRHRTIGTASGNSELARAVCGAAVSELSAYDRNCAPLLWTRT